MIVNNPQLLNEHSEGVLCPSSKWYSEQSSKNITEVWHVNSSRRLVGESTYKSRKCLVHD